MSRVTDIVLAHASGEMTTSEMMGALLAHTYTAGQYDPTGGDGYIPGDWGEIEAALLGGYLTDDQYEYIAREAKWTQ